MYTIWDRFMSYNLANRIGLTAIVLSFLPVMAVHCCMLSLHLAGYDPSMDELKNFRQWGDKTPGHPEVGLTPGVDVSTGPLGHGFAMGIGFAIAEAMLGAKYNKPDFPVVNHYTLA